MKEMPAEIFKNVQSVMDVELMKMKNELNFQQNVLGEQILNLKVSFIITIFGIMLLSYFKYIILF